MSGMSRLALAALLLLLGGCAALPAPAPVDLAADPALLALCRRPFLTERTRLVHALEARLPDGSRVTAIGVVVADPRDGALRSVLMTLEGWVLFDMEDGTPPKVHRAVPPFEASGLARRMAGDIRLAFFPPAGEPLGWRRAETDETVCRWPEDQGRYVEVGVWPRRGTEVRLYEEGRLVRRVVIPVLERPGLAGRLEIRAETIPSYGLSLELLESETLDGPPPAAGR